MDVGVLSFKFGFKLDRLGEPGGAPLAQVVTELVDQAKCDVVLYGVADPAVQETWREKRRLLG